ncbi:uncharacterized protein LY89DRAFT_352668 [Mollisia scopiformis]|uniref:Uncharacterized protein n=1 Tax=Mollisia scopiformis TaxID=149040 RepID=A0A132B704_MOLSC|nr:uncharacterized protein LY89DRAFT_352668 [Mollisia scopiformis]KUJ07779.1 hypothetical protein LY89DRAFT_352668 [Mollisia scopiformis]
METDILEQVQNLYPTRRPNEAALFIENRVILSQESDLPIYESQLDQFVSREAAYKQQIISAELWKNADEEKEKLFALVEQVQAKLSKTKVPQKNTKLRSCKWEEVISEVKDTSQKWKTSPSRTARARRCVEKLGQDSGALQAWVGLLPAGDYGSSICGAFKLAIGAASQLHKVEDCIFDALVEIPECMENARRYVSIYKDHPDQYLERKTFDLYLAVLRALSHIMQAFADDGIHRFLGSMAKQSTYKEELFKSVQEVKKLSGKIKEEAQQCLAERQARMNKTIDETHRSVDKTEKLVQSIYCMLVERMTSESKGLALANLQASAGSTPKKAIMGPHQSLKETKKLLKMLDYNARLPADDLEACLKLADLLDEEPMARAAAMVQHDKLRIWLAEGSSSRALLVNGNSDLGSAEGQSPLSLVDAELVKISESMEAAFVIKYFCGLHTQNLDPSPASSPVGMMASLVGQLLSQMIDREMDVDVSFLEKSNWKDVESHNLFALYMVFRNLVEQLPPKTLLVCVLDEVSLYETRSMGGETDTVMRRLTRLVANSTDVTFKMLVTCRGRALDFQQYFHPDILDLDEDIEVDDMAMWNIKHIRGSE